MNFNVSISRCSDDTISITIQEEKSGIRFLSMSMAPEAFGNAVTGLSSQRAVGDVRALQFVGKVKVTEPRTCECPLSFITSREELSQWLNDNKQEEGWMLSTYLGAQGSVVRIDGKTFLNYGVIKYVEGD